MIHNDTSIKYTSDFRNNLALFLKDYFITNKINLITTSYFPFHKASVKSLLKLSKKNIPLDIFKEIRKHIGEKTRKMSGSFSKRDTVILSKKSNIIKLMEEEITKYNSTLVFSNIKFTSINHKFKILKTLLPKNIYLKIIAKVLDKNILRC